MREPRARKGADLASDLRLRERFSAAILAGDLAALQRVLADDVVMLADSNGKAVSALVPVRGSDRVGRFFLGVAPKTPPGTRIELATVNGLPGFVFSDANGIFQTTALETRDERIVAVYITRNPDKLVRVTARSW